METRTLQVRRPPNDPADFVANRVKLPGVTEIQYDAEIDQMQVGARPSDYRALAESVRASDHRHDLADLKSRLTPWADIEDERDKLVAVLEEFQAKEKNESAVEKINVRKSSWPEVMKLIERAENQYKNEKLTGALGHFRKCLRKLGDNGEVFENWLRILPNGDYGSVVSGSFQVIIKVSCPQICSS